MAENHFSETIESLFKGMDEFVTTKTVVGEAVKVGDTIILQMPGEEGYPAYLSSRLAESYERAGEVRCIGKEGRVGAISARL